MADPKEVAEDPRNTARNATPNPDDSTVEFDPHDLDPDLTTPDDLSELDDIERIESEQGFRFGDPDGEAARAPKATRALICRNPDCSMQGEHVAVHHDTVQPIRCGGLVTDPTTGDTRPCSAVLHCDHETETTTTTEGTLAAPVKITVTKCTKCQTITDKTEEPQPPVNLGDLPVGILETLGTTPVAGADESTA